MSDLHSPYSEIFDLIIKVINTKADGTFSVADLRSFGKQGYPPAIIRSALRFLEQEKYVVEVATKKREMNMLGFINQEETSTIYWELGESGISYWQFPPKIQIPASDRFVAPGDNSPDVSNADAVLERLSKAVEGDNRLFADHDHKLSVLSEINNIRQMIKQKSIRSYSIWAFTSHSGILGWLTKTAATSIVGNLAKEAVESLLKIIGLL